MYWKIKNIQQDSIENIWNNEKYKTIRLNMIADKPSVECKRCMTEESWSNQSMRISESALLIWQKNTIFQQNKK